MKRSILLALSALALAAPLAARQGPAAPGESGPPGRSYANPSGGIAADIALARLTADRKGRWHALRATAAEDAVILAPRLVLAQPWLKQRKDAAPPFRLQPFQAWASCDGSLVITSGLREEAGARSRYTHVWRRQDDGGYKWVFGHRLPLDSPAVAQDMIEAKVAECPPRSPAAKGAASPPPRRQKAKKAPPVAIDPAGREGGSRDGSLTWRVVVGPEGSHRFTASIRRDGTMHSIRDERVEAEG